MSTSMDMLRAALGGTLSPPLEPDTFEQEHREEQEVRLTPQRGDWDPEQFAEDQIRGLVRQVFFPGWPKPSRQVLFSAVEATTYVAEICMRVAESLAASFPGNIAVVEANYATPELETVFGGESYGARQMVESPGVLRSLSTQVSRNLWLMPSTVFHGERRDRCSPAWLRGRMYELGLEFDYTVLHGPPAGQNSEAAALGVLCDGVVLALEANSTRRVAARKAKEMLHSSNVRFLGTILSERTFPVPTGIYKRL